MQNLTSNLLLLEKRIEEIFERVNSEYESIIKKADSEYEEIINSLNKELEKEQF